MTIRVGINSAHAKSRVSQMMPFGRDKMLQPAEVDNVVDYVRTLSDPSAAKDLKPGNLAAGKTTFDASCASCHGRDGKGNVEVGGPDLTDRNWIYGGDAQSIVASVWSGRQGLMPSWEGRLTAAERKILALYVVSLRGGKP